MSDDYQRIATAIRYLRVHRVRQPELAEVAAALAISPGYLQRVFQRWAGVSPKRMLQILTVAEARRMLREDASVLETSLGVGLSGPGRLHDHFVALEAVTPGEYRSGGAGLNLRYGSAPSRFGRLFGALSERGLCALRFVDEDELPQALTALREEWPGARLKRDDSAFGAVVGRMFAAESADRIPLLVRGTNFQVQVWRALLQIPPGHLATYTQIARALGRNAPRAVANAIGANPIAYLIPCHRVITASGALSGYRWGAERKQALIAWERAQRERG